MELDAQARTLAWRDDTYYLRIIISAEDGEALGELRPMVREVMAGLEARLATRLDWLAIDHWDTDNPHTHVLVRGRTAEGKDLPTSRETITRALGEHARVVMTRLLGPRSEAELDRESEREIVRKGVTAIDRRLAAEADPDRIVSARIPSLIARLDLLEIWGLARREGQSWRLGGDLLASLRDMERHAEVEAAVSFHRSGGRRLPVLGADPRQLTRGVLIHRGPADAFGDGLLAVIETGQGELRYQRFERERDMAQLRGLPPGAIITFEPNTPRIRTADHAIAAIAERTGGLYSAALHFEAAPAIEPGLVTANIRRLETMQRLSLIARTQDGDFIAGHDHLRRARIFEGRIAQRYPLSPMVLSYWSLEQQLDAAGPTHLDRVLAGEAAPLDGVGEVARRHAAALQQRRAFLIDQGWMRNDETVLSRSALARMAERELRGVAEELSKELGKPVAVGGAGAVRGVYARRFDLAQGRTVVVEEERQARLIAWAPALERLRGRTIEGVVHGPGAPLEQMRGMGLAIG